MSQPLRKAGSIIAALLSLAGGIALLRDTAYQGQDFEVFWRAARAVHAGQPAYDLARDGGMVFKYPPWVLPAFLPFSLLPLAWAKWVWAAVEALGLFSVVLWVAGKCRSGLIVILGVFAFWGIWAVHFMDGQIELPLLALALGAGTRRGVYPAFSLLWSLSAKIFNAISLLGAAFVRNGPLRVLPALLLLAVLSVPACWVTPGRSPAALARSWATAAASGGSLLGGDKVRGRDNQGFPALILRTAEVPPERTDFDLAAFLAVAFALAALWALAGRHVDESARWAGWLAVGVAAHPLAWFHLYVFAFPLAVLSVDRAVDRRHRVAVSLAIAGGVAMSLITRKTLGGYGAAAELASVKAWGILLCLASLWLSSRGGKVRAASPA